MQNRKAQIRSNIALIAASFAVALFILLIAVFQKQAQAVSTKSPSDPIYNENSICKIQWKRPNGTWGEWKTLGYCYGSMYCSGRVYNAVEGGKPVHVRVCKKP